jgi:hypothetical protein
MVEQSQLNNGVLKKGSWDSNDVKDTSEGVGELLRLMTMRGCGGGGINVLWI